MTRTKIASNITTSNEHIDITETRGARLVRSTAVFTLLALPADGWTQDYEREPGTYYGLCVQSTRNGKKFGACQHTRYFATEAARERAAAQYLERRKRAGK